MILRTMAATVHDTTGQLQPQFMILQDNGSHNSWYYRTMAATVHEAYFPTEETYKFISHCEYLCSIQSCMHMILMSIMVKKEKCKEKILFNTSRAIHTICTQEYMFLLAMMMQSNGYTSSRIWGADTEVFIWVFPSDSTKLTSHFTCFCICHVTTDCKK